MEKIKSRWRKNYLNGDIDEAKDDNSDTGGYTTNNKLSNNITLNNSIGNIDHNNHYHSNNYNHHSSHLNNNNSQNHHHYHHSHHNNLNSNSNNINKDSNNIDTLNTTAATNNTSQTTNHHNNSSSGSKHSTPPTFDILKENLYLDKRKNDHSRSRKDARSMVCDCILTKEERARGVTGCLDDCLNRMLMIECGPKCSLGDHCLNKRFQKFQSAKVEAFKTRKKGWGLRTINDLPANSFIMEYVGEVVRSKEFRSRVKKYTKQKIKHHYFMALRSDEIIDATVKGNYTRFINHSCEPNCETQKWTVNGELRIGFFTIRNLQAGEEITFDYQFQRYGRKAQKCYCDAPSCRGYIGGNEQSFSLNGSSSPQINENKSHKKAYKHGHLLVDVNLEDKINALAEHAAMGLKTKDQVIALASLSIKAEEVSDRKKLLDIIKATKSEISLRLFVDYHGLEILCLWMRDPEADCDFKATIIDVLEKLPIPNKTKVVESNVFRMIERWATEEPKSVTPAELHVNINSNSEFNTTSTTTPSSPDKRLLEKGDDEIELPSINNGSCTKSQESTKSQTDADTLTNDDSNASSQTPQATSASSPSSQPRTGAATIIRSSSNTTLLPIQTTNSPNIKALASRLLKKFQALSPGFKIPRLNRLQRMEIEKKMNEEVNNCDDSTNDQKTPFSVRNYFKSTIPTTLATTNGLANTSNLAIKPGVPPLKRRYDSIGTNNIDLTPEPKISKEEHRQQFEMHVRLKAYYDDIEKQYGPAAVEQLKLTQRAFNPSTIDGIAHPQPAPPPPPHLHPAYSHHIQSNVQNPLNFLAAAANHHASPAMNASNLNNISQQSNLLSLAAAAAVVGNSNTSSHLMYSASTIAAIEAETQRYQQQSNMAAAVAAATAAGIVPPTTVNMVAPSAVNNFHLSSHLQQVSNTVQHEVALSTYHPSVDFNTSTATSVDTASEMEVSVVKSIRPEPTVMPTIKTLANHYIEPAHLIDDDLAFSICGYDKYYKKRNKPLTIDDVNDHSNPYPGSYYTTPDGETWFATVILDRKTQQPKTVIFKDLNQSINRPSKKSRKSKTSEDDKNHQHSSSSTSGAKKKLSSSSSSASLKKVKLRPSRSHNRDSLPIDEKKDMGDDSQ